MMKTPSAKVTVASISLMAAGCGMIILGAAEISWLRLDPHVKTELQASGIQCIGMGLAFLGIGRLLSGIKDDIAENTSISAAGRQEASDARQVTEQNQAAIQAVLPAVASQVMPPSPTSASPPVTHYEAPTPPLTTEETHHHER
jgi:hypothetical protein